MKTMEWEERVWLGLKDAVSEMPPFVRGRALRKIIATAETEARGRNSARVEAVDLWAAVDIAVPVLIKPMCKNALKGAGL
jgi:hypothetical protein